MKEPFSLRDIGVSLQKQAAFHREQMAQHAGKEAFHRELRTTHETELGIMTSRLEAFRAATAAADRRFGSGLRSRIEVRQIADILRRLARTGSIHRLRTGIPHHESRYVRRRP